ncbi:uncharacterized protein [Oscarella lobularis]|uniref:uncharacterized protein isoform X2 n=1 Tax=Oscarella lobularis TaxID=121494 RepID=UPI003313E53A
MVFQTFAFLAVLALATCNDERNIPQRTFSAEELAQYDGSDPEKPIYMAVKGVVFDVTKGREFYGKEGTYNVMAGKDPSHAIAKWSLEVDDIHDNIDSLSSEQKAELDKIFRDVYQAKYPVVGRTEKYAYFRERDDAAADRRADL